MELSANLLVLSNNFWRLIDDKLTVAELPDFYKRTFSHPCLQKRGFIYDDYDSFPVGVTSRLNNRFADYVIFPVSDNWYIVGFVSRHVWSKYKIDAYNRKAKISVEYKSIAGSGEFDGKHQDLNDYGEEVFLRGFGRFIIKHRAKKTVRNITKNTIIIVPAHNIPAFKPVKSFVENIK